MDYAIKSSRDYGGKPWERRGIQESEAATVDLGLQERQL